MAWTAPMTAVANTAFTAAQFNLYVRDNLNETAPAKASVAGRIFVATGPNAIAERIVAEATIGATETTTSTTYADLTTVGPTQSLETGTSALVVITARAANSGAGNRCFVGVAVSGASTVAPDDADALEYQAAAANARHRGAAAALLTGLTPGINTFTLKYRVDAGTGTFDNRKILGIGL